METEQYRVQPDGTLSRFQPPAVQGGKVAAAAGSGAVFCCYNHLDMLVHLAVRRHV